MGATLRQTVAALVGRLQRAARRMASGGGGKRSPSRAVVAPWKKTFSTAPAAKEAEASGVWRKEILMGERCQRLEFSGVIYYDAEGRRLSQPPPPRSPMRSPLPASPRLAANARAVY